MKKTLSTLALVSIIALSPAVALAQTPGGGGTSNPAAGGSTDNGQATQGTPIRAGLPNPLGGTVNSLPGLFDSLVNLAMQLAYIVIAFFLLLSGFKFVKARGNESELENAKKTFYYTIIGALIIIGANVIISVVKSIIHGL